MSEKQEYRQEYLTGERALFKGEGLRIYDTIFADGESPLKESRDIELYGCMFKWKYPLWYSRDITVKNSTWFEMARAGVWYTRNITVEDSAIEAPKNFRRCGAWSRCSWSTRPSAARATSRRCRVPPTPPRRSGAVTASPLSV